jgi:lipopolysaccharide export system protein LptA
MKIPTFLVCGALACPLVSLPAAEPVAQKTTLDCEHAEMWSVGDETRGVCTGAVTLIGTDLKIVCDRLEFTALGVGDKSATLPALDKFKYMLATGHVVILQGEREATCGRAEVLPHEDKVVLTENPKLIDHGTDWTSAGEKITLLRGERRVIVDKSHVTGPSIRDLGYEKSPTVPPADGAAKPAPVK